MDYFLLNTGNVLEETLRNRVSTLITIGCNDVFNCSNIRLRNISFSYSLTEIKHIINNNNIKYNNSLIQ